MSIVLEALEKAQREGKRFTQVYVERTPQKEQRPQLKTKSKHKIFIFGSIIFVTIINIIFLGWWVDRNNSIISIKMPSISPVSLTQKTSLKKSSRFNVTGVVWDEKEPIAIVNGKFLKEGDQILGARIIDIKLHEVRFLHRNKEFTISVE